VISDADLLLILDALEAEESKLLSWGDTGGAFSEEELEAICERLLPESDFDDLLDELEERALVYDVRLVNGTKGYRSRMAHSVHLYRNLRQWMHGQVLNASKSLVSDFRFLRKPRRYPERNQNLTAVLSGLSDHGLNSTLIAEALSNQVTDNPLAGFQVRAIAKILKGYSNHKARKRKPTATIISAGTGSGKTLAFYLPALSAVTSGLAMDAGSRVRILAIYPRKELLKDQFNEVWKACRQLDSLAIKVAGRKLTIGAFFGDTPDTFGGLKLPKLRLMQCSYCGAEMRWSEEDVAKKIERLTCRDCGDQTGVDEIMLTRSTMAKSPPDILFTTTEMLNQRLGDARLQKLFGINTTEPIPIVLLDEVHTYDGNHGAQVAFLLRRWMKVARTAPHFVGLSATLVDGERFFARLTSTDPMEVDLVEPNEQEMLEEGSEYLMVLRGDPVSQAALLSTTIQAAMLTRRVLDGLNKPSKGIWGSKTYLFTDELDVANRLHADLADAEGYWLDSNGRRYRKPGPGPLAQLRNPATGGIYREGELERLGQNWQRLRKNGFSLDSDDRAEVSKTTSQSPGVEAGSDVVVASASLEVGFNDPCVGAVIQHKAPRSTASYLQRKGRAGRTRGMRPWMVVVLSDFGQDRVQFQNYEKLIEPEINLQSLPLGNSHILSMNAAMAALNWFEIKLVGFNFWSSFNPPQNEKLAAKFQEVLVLVEEVLQPGIAQEEFSEYLKNALKLTDRQLTTVLWQPPRSIMMEFLPTIRRHMSTQWGKWNDQSNQIENWVESNKSRRSPVPGFIPNSLYSDLDLTEIEILLDRGNVLPVREGMSLFQGLKTFAPGRISKRFSTKGPEADWVIPADFQASVDLHNTVVAIDVNAVFGDLKLEVGHCNLPNGDRVKVLKPLEIKTAALFNDREVGNTSNAFLSWHSCFTVDKAGEVHPTLMSSAWVTSLLSVEFYTHRSMTEVEVTRFNTGSDADIKLRESGENVSVRFDWSENGQTVAVGFRQPMDAIKFNLNLSETDVITWWQDLSLQAGLRVAFFQDQLAESLLIPNRFISDWIFECFLVAVVLEQDRKEISIEQAIENVRSGLSELKLWQVPTILFKGNMSDLGLGRGEDVTEELEGSFDAATLQIELVTQLQNQELVDDICRFAAYLSSNLVDEPLFISWSFEVLGNTISAALKQTILTLLPDLGEGTFLLDPDLNNESGEHTIWLSEVSSGGTGIVMQVQDLYTEDPLGFLNVLSQELQFSETEQVDEDLVSLLTNIKDKGVQELFKGVRESSNFKERSVSNIELKKGLSKRGYQFSHSFASVLHSRILKAGSSDVTDNRLAGYLTKWQAIEDKIGLELPLNTVTVILAYIGTVSDGDLSNLYSETCSVQAVLWPRGVQLRQSALQFYNHFRVGKNSRTDRKLANKLCINATKIIEVVDAQGDWLVSLHQIITKTGRADLLFGENFIELLGPVLARIFIIPIEIGGLLVYPRIETMQRRQRSLRVRVELAEPLL